MTHGTIAVRSPGIGLAVAALLTASFVTGILTVALFVTP